MIGPGNARIVIFFEGGGETQMIEINGSVESIDFSEKLPDFGYHDLYLSKSTSTPYPKKFEIHGELIKATHFKKKLPPKS